jgi:hypothetical protein
MTTSNNTVLLFSHGFGIRKDNLGLFTYFSERFQQAGYDTVLFDYYEYNEETKEVITVPFSKHAEVLQEQIEKVKSKYPGKEIIIIAQSQGSIIPAFCDVTGITKVIGISPFFLTDKEEVMKRYSARPGSQTDFDKVSRRPHSDGKVTVIPPEYWTERFSTNVADKYNALALKTDLVLIYGTKDKLVESIDLDELKNMSIIELEGDHDFTGEYKVKLLEVVEKELLS